MRCPATMLQPGSFPKDKGFLQYLIRRSIIVSQDCRTSFDTLLLLFHRNHFSGSSCGPGPTFFFHPATILFHQHILKGVAASFVQMNCSSHCAGSSYPPV